MWNLFQTCSNNRTAAVPAELTVDVININDNPPVFDRSNLTVQLDEESEQGTLSSSSIAAPATVTSLCRHCGDYTDSD